MSSVSPATTINALDVDGKSVEKGCEETQPELSRAATDGDRAPEAPLKNKWYVRQARLREIKRMLMIVLECQDNLRPAEPSPSSPSAREPG